MPELIPATIRSRCQRIIFSPLPFAEMGRLFENIPDAKTVKEEKILTALSAGRPGWALSDSLLEKRNRLFNEFKNLIDGIEEDLWEGRDSMEEWFEWVNLWLRDIAVLKVTGSEDMLINQDRKKEIEDISKKAELNAILELAVNLNRIREFLRFNLNRRITLHHTHLLLKKTFG